VKPMDSKRKQAECSCVKDPFASVPSEMRSRPRKESSLRKVTCPGCGLVYSTNRATDLCMDCERKENGQP
jgi:hypothetical protein